MKLATSKTRTPTTRPISHNAFDLKVADAVFDSNLEIS